MDAFLSLASIAGKVEVAEVLLATSVQDGHYKLKVEVALRQVECGDRLRLLNEGQCTLRVRAQGIPRKVKVHQSELHVLVLFHAVC